MVRMTLVWSVVGLMYASNVGCAVHDDERCPMQAEPEVDLHDLSRFEALGPATEPGDQLRTVADQLRDSTNKSSTSLSDARIIWAVDGVLHAHLKLVRDRDLVLTRTARNVWSSGRASGCHDLAITAASVLRMLGHPIIFVETVHDSYLQGESSHGHVFLEVWLGGQGSTQNETGWVLYDPTNSKLWEDHDPTSLSLPSGYHVMGRYADPWQANLSGSHDLLACMAEVRDAQGADQP
ncbi:MAG: transglutaminase domain-containing protein [Deltaproteobacteria bacterium]|nr:transglutaminase domain-containing protein [Deltaproteobacteria bacterium]